jgi:hypothetical protein
MDCESEELLRESLIAFVTSVEAALSRNPESDIERSVYDGDKLWGKDGTDHMKEQFVPEDTPLSSKSSEEEEALQVVPEFVMEGEEVVAKKVAKNKPMKKNDHTVPEVEAVEKTREELVSHAA